MKKIFTAAITTIALAITAGVSAQEAPGVVQMILFDYDGDPAAMVEDFKARQAIYGDINPEASLRLLFDEVHGGAVGRYRIHIDYPSLAYFAAAQGREASSEEWQSLSMGGSTTRVYEGLSRMVQGPAGAPPPPGDTPGVVQIILLRLDDGTEADLAAQFQKSQAIYADINPEASMRLMSDEIHGPSVGRYRIHVYYPSLAYFAAAQGREMASEEWRQRIQPGLATRTYEGLSRVVVSSR